MTCDDYDGSICVFVVDLSWHIFSRWLRAMGVSAQRISGARGSSEVGFWRVPGGSGAVELQRVPMFRKMPMALLEKARVPEASGVREFQKLGGFPGGVAGEAPDLEAHERDSLTRTAHAHCRNRIASGDGRSFGASGIATLAISLGANVQGP